MRIAILVEGDTERAFKAHLTTFLRTRLAGAMPKLDFRSFHGPLPTGDKLQRIVRNLLSDRKRPADAVIGLTDVYTGSNHPEFQTAEDAKKKMREWVGNEERFHPHVALHDFEAWLLPYWSKITRITGSNHKSPGPDPERVNHNKSPAKVLAEEFKTGKKTNGYVKVRDAGRILAGADLLVAINACSELKAFVNTILSLCDPTKRVA